MAGKNTMLEVGTLIVPVKLEKVSTRADVKIDRASPDGNPLKRIEIDSVTGATVESDEVQKGVFDGEEFMAIPKEALDAIDEETQIDSFEIGSFMPLADVPWERVRDAYYLTPQKGTSGKALVLLHEALRKTKRAGILKLTLRSRQYPAVVYAQNGGLFVSLLHFASDFRKAQDAQLPDVGADKATVGLAVDLVNALTGSVEDLDALEDDLIPLKQALVDKALAGQAVTARKRQKKAVAAADGLEAMLRESVAAASKEKAKV